MDRFPRRCSEGCSPAPDCAQGKPGAVPAGPPRVGGSVAGDGACGLDVMERSGS